MTCTPRPASRHHRIAAFAAGILYALSASILPVLHAETEDLAGATTVERTHSTQCDRIHSDISCPAGGLARALAGDGPLLVLVPVARIIAPSGIPADLPAVPERFSSRSIRGPPAT